MSIVTTTTGTTGATGAGVEEDRWHAVWLRGGQISEIVWIGRDVLAWCSGLHVVFLDVPSNKVRLSNFDSHVTAAGVSCLSGHLSQRIFAFAEKNHKPRISVYSYPSLTRICKCTRETDHHPVAYLATAFAGDYLVSLNSIPDFKLTIWSWRSGEKIASVVTTICDAEDYGQTLKANFSMPIFIAQIGNSCGRLCTWEMTVYSTTCILNKNDIFLPSRKALVKDVSWCPDSSDVLAVVDRDGNIYLSDPRGDGMKRIVLTQRCGICVDIEPAAITWHRNGIVLRTTFCQIRFYRPIEYDGPWRKVWHRKSAYYPIALTSHPFRNDRLFFATREGHVVQIILSDEDPNEVVKDMRYFNGGKYKFVDFVNPWNDHLVAVDLSMDISVIEAQNGVEVARVNLQMNGDVTNVISHPLYPLLVACSDKGEVAFVSVLRYHDPKILGRFRMQFDGLETMRFSSTGRHLTVCQKAHGICYIFNISLDQPISVISRLNAGFKIVDVMLHEKKDSLKLCLLQNSSHVAPIGHHIFIYDIHNKHEEFTKATHAFFLKRSYRHLHYSPGGNSDFFVGTPYLTKQLRFFQINDWKDIHFFDAIPTNHNVRQVRIHMSKNWLVTCGLDGSITVKSANVRSRLERGMHFMTHHQTDFGVTKAIVNSTGDLLIALGNDGSLVAVKILELEKESQFDENSKHLREFGCTDFENHEDKVSAYMKSLDKRLIEFLFEQVNIFKDFEELGEFILDESLTWTEWRKRQKLHEEKLLWSNENEKIMLEFTTLKNKVCELLDKNETCLEFKKLPISNFALDKTFHEKRVKVAKDERAEVRHELESDCQERERVSQWIKRKYWDPQRVLAKSIFGIFDDTEVTNYTICIEKLGTSETFEYAQFARHVFRDLTSSGSINPWENYTTSEIDLLFDKQLRVKKSDDIAKIGKLVEYEDEIEVVGEDEQQNKYALEGMTTRNFIDPCALYYSQFQIYAFSQLLRDNLNNAEDSKNLRFYFNKQFDEMYFIKEREMSLVRERIDRIIFISSELHTMFDEQIPETFAYPEWNLKEKPETIIQVTDDELSLNIYVSPSQQEILNKKAAEEERARLALLADDFRERALQAMMDGVLEVRWEDLIKREPTKPDCLVLGKSPEDYTDEETLAVKRYERELRNLEAERERYRKILQMDYVKINEMLSEGIERFNVRLEEFHLLKMKVEAAIEQLNFRYIRGYVRHVKRIQELKENDTLRAKIKEKQKLITLLSEQMKIIQNTEQELREQYENLLAKEKLMEKKLKGEFTALGKNAFAAISMQYKRRPRIVLKTASSAEMLDLGKSITSMFKFSYLTLECLEYLKQLEMLDIRPTTLPQSVEASHWENLVALRRLKIDHELRQRAVARDLDEATRALVNYSRRCAELRDACEAILSELADSRRTRIEHGLDAELQLVLKMGQVEVEQLRGDVHQDTTGAVLIPRADIDAVNKAIIKAGAKKLRAMERSLEFRRNILVEEWEHACLRTRLQHFGTELYYVTMVTVTREMRKYLKRKAKGQREDNSAAKMNKEFQVVRRNQEKLLKDWETKLKGVTKEVQRLEKKNEKLDFKIKRMNVDRCEMELKRNVKGEKRQKEFRERILQLVTERSAVLRKLLANYEELLKIREKQKKLRCSGGVLVQYVPDDLSIEEN